jgi:hypothetical protein
MDRRRQTQARKNEPDAADAAVADRFRYFLEAARLDRESFVAGVDGAISAKSLFSVLSGDRRPSRALAVLIERTWGFRATFLLDGRGPMWTGRRRGDGADREDEAAPPLSTLSHEEAAVVAYMRRSVENARTMEAELVRAELWERLFARALALIGEVEACGRSRDPGDVAIYPLFVKLVYEECQFAAERFAQLGALSIRRRVNRLTDRYLERYLDEVPRALLDPAEHEALARTLRPVLARRQKSQRAIDASIAALTTTLENLVELGSPRALLAATAQQRRSTRGRALAERLYELCAQIPAKAVPPALTRALATAVAEVEKSAGAAPSLSELLQRLARDLLSGLEVDVALESQSVEELRARHHATVAPLTA